MDIFKVIRTRRSIRSFSDEPIPPEHLKLILESAIWAPSAGNLQSWEFIIVRDKERKKSLAKAALNQRFIEQAPVVIVVGANTKRSSSIYGNRGKNLYVIQDTAAAIMNLMLAAWALGYGTCWVGAFRDNEVSKIVCFPDYIRPVAIIPLGKPTAIPSAPPRFPLSYVTHCEVFGNPCEFGEDNES